MFPCQATVALATLWFTAPIPLPPLLRQPMFRPAVGLLSLAGRCTAVLQGHADGVTCIAAIPETSRLVSGSVDKSIRVWDYAAASGGACLHTMVGHTGRINALVVVAPSVVASASGDRTLRYWDCDRGGCVHTQLAHTGDVTVVQSLHDSRRRLVTASWDQTIRVWRGFASVKRCSTLDSHTNTITRVGASPDGSVVVSSSHDCTLRIWDADTGACLRELAGHTAHVNSFEVGRSRQP
jgi:WD40 repeat protein